MRSEEYVKTEKWLTRAYKAQVEIDHLMRELNRLRDESVQIVSPPGQGGRSSMPSDKVGRAASRLADEYERLREMLNRAKDAKWEIRETIMEYTETPRHEEVLLRRYVEFQSWEEIASEMHYDWKYVYALRREGIEQIIENKGQGLRKNKPIC